MRLIQSAATGLRIPASSLRVALAAVGRGLAWTLRNCGPLRPAQALTLGFLLYMLAGTLLLCLPFARTRPVGLLDNLFNAVSAVSTTGLTTVSVCDSYSLFGQFVLLLLFQVGGIGYMTVSSFVILARGRPLSAVRMGILTAEFSLPAGFELRSFVQRVVAFSVVIEAAGFLLLWREFAGEGMENAAWSALFHCVSAFATAGFGLYNNSFETFAGNTAINATLGGLCFAGAIGFIVLQDAWLSVRHPLVHRITLTSKIILVATVGIFVVGSALLYLGEPAIQAFPPYRRLLAATFQVMAGSTTAGFNSIPIGRMSFASLLVIIMAMLIGASPSGTGGGIKTTSVSALLSVMYAALRGKAAVTCLGREIPLMRVRTAVASTALYLMVLALGDYLLCLTQPFGFLELLFEASSALGTVGLSMGITGALGWPGKLILISLMFIGRVGPLTLGVSLFHTLPERRRQDNPSGIPLTGDRRSSIPRDDIAV